MVIMCEGSSGRSGISSKHLKPALAGKDHAAFWVTSEPSEPCFPRLSFALPISDCCEITMSKTTYTGYIGVLLFFSGWCITGHCQASRPRRVDLSGIDSSEDLQMASCQRGEGVSFWGEGQKI